MRYSLAVLLVLLFKPWPCSLRAESNILCKPILFAVDSWALPDTVERDMKACVEDIRDISLCVVGLTDHSGSEEWNMRLSHLRATAVRDFLVERGMKRENLKVVALASKRPVCPESESECQFQNRRVKLFGVPKDKFPDFCEARTLLEAGGI